MKRHLKAACILFFLWALAFSGTGRAGGPAGVDPSSYPGMSDKELGQLRWTLMIADQPLDDFTHLEALDQRGMTAYRYAMAFMSYFLAVEQYHKLPACPGIIKPRMDRFIKKMIQKPVWEFWAEVSQGLKAFQPKMNKPYPEEHDPVANRNIMYSGHLGHMIALYEMLYRDLSWSEPGSIVFEWSGDEKYVYDNHSLQRVMYDQMKNRVPHCIECEPNACFPECNQHPLLSFMLYDYIHGTDLFEVREDFLDFFLSYEMIDPETHETAALYLVAQDMVISQDNPRFGNALDLVLIPVTSLGIISVESASANGWTGTFMHAWQPEYIERHYPYQREHHIKRMTDETAALKYDFFEPRLPYGFFAMLAAEMGDQETRDKLLKKAEQKYEPVWKDGAFYYPFDLDKKCSSLTGKLLAIARANPEDGMWRMHNKPFDERHFEQPRLAGVDFPRVLLRRAIYDREKQALIVTTVPGGAGEKTSLEVVQLDPARTYELFMDGEHMKSFKAKESISIEIGLEGEHDLVLAAR